MKHTCNYIDKRRSGMSACETTTYVIHTQVEFESKTLSWMKSLYAK